jgi:hypothetical protein
MMDDDGDEANKRNLDDQQQYDRLDRKNNPLPENISEYVQRARNELKQYEEQKKFYEKRRKKEIIVELVDLLEEHDYPNEWLRLIIAQELGDYISTSYIEKILAEKYPDEKNVKKQPTRQTTEIPRIDDRIPIELSTTGEGLVDNDYDLESVNSNDTIQLSTKDSAESKTDLELQAEKGVREKVKKLQQRAKDLETKCYQLGQLAQEGSMWKEKYTLLQQEFRAFKNKIIRGATQIEFGSELLPVKIEYNFKTNQFSARIPEEVIERVLRAMRHQE